MEIGVEDAVGLEDGVGLEDAVGLEDTKVNPRCASIDLMDEELSESDKQEFNMLAKVPKQLSLHEACCVIEDRGESPSEYFRELSRSHISDGRSIEEILETCELNSLEQNRPISPKDPDFHGRKNEQKECLKFLMEENDSVSGLEITGKSGMGKTALAEEICHKLSCRGWTIIPVQGLRGRTSEKDLCLCILHYLTTKSLNTDNREALLTQRTTFVQSFSQNVHALVYTIRRRLKAMKTETVVFMDNIDDIYTHQKEETLKILMQLMRVKNKKVKLLWTIERSLVGEMEDKRFKTWSLQVHPLRTEDAIKLVYSLGKRGEHINFVNKEAFVKSCENCPMLIKAVAGLLSEDSMVGDQIRENQILEQAISSMDKSLQRVLFKLSELKTPFDNDLAIAVLGGLEEMNRLKYIVKKEIVDLKLCHEEQEKHFLNSIHPVVLSSLSNFSELQPFKESIFEAQHRLTEFFSKNLYHGTQWEWTFYGKYYEYQSHLKRLFSLNPEHDFPGKVQKPDVFFEVAEFSVDLQEQEDFLIKLSQKHDCPKNLYFATRRVLICMKTDKQKADKLFKIIQPSLETVEKMKKDIHVFYTLELYYYVDGLLRVHKENCDEAITLFNKALKYSEKIKTRENSEMKQKAKILNAIGMCYHEKKNYQTAFDYQKAAFIEAKHSICPDALWYEKSMADTAVDWGKQLQYDLKRGIKRVESAVYKSHSNKQRKLSNERRGQNYKQPISSRQQSISDYPSPEELYGAAKKRYKNVINGKEKQGFIDLMSVECHRAIADIHRLLGEYLEGEKIGRTAFHLLKAVYAEDWNSVTEEFIHILHVLGLITFKVSSEAALKRSLVYYDQLTAIVTHYPKKYDVNLLREAVEAYGTVLLKLNDRRRVDILRFYGDTIENGGQRLEAEEYTFVNVREGMFQLCPFDDDDYLSDDDDDDRSHVDFHRLDSGIGSCDRTSKSLHRQEGFDLQEQKRKAFVSTHAKERMENDLFRSPATSQSLEDDVFKSNESYDSHEKPRLLSTQDSGQGESISGP